MNRLLQRQRCRPLVLLLALAVLALPIGAQNQGRRRYDIAEGGAVALLAHRFPPFSVAALPAGLLSSSTLRGSSLVDRTAKHGAIHSNAADRTKARLTLALNRAGA